MARRSRPFPWFHDFRQRLRFEARVRTEFGALESRKVGRGWEAEITYTLRVVVPGFNEARRITIRLMNSVTPHLIGVLVDGPTESPHRYRPSGHLCMWRPDADPAARWTPDEGLWALIQYARLHLFREAYWRKTGGYNGGIWVGDEAPHHEEKDEAA